MQSSETLQDFSETSLRENPLSNSLNRGKMYTQQQDATTPNINFELEKNLREINRLLRTLNDPDYVASFRMRLESRTHQQPPSQKTPG